MRSISRRLVWVLLSVAALLGATEALAYLSFKRYGEGIDGMPTVAWEEFPDIDRSLLEKFESFDAELGWVPQPNTVKQKDTGDHLPGEEVKNVVEYSTDEYGSRICPARDRDPDAEFSVSMYGDSYCFCRGVDDDETIQHYLAERLDTHVGNYGGGNYGFDQALMRLKRKYDEDPTEYVFITVTASSIARILSVWKHYQEFGNVLAVKPRYVLEDGELERTESPIEEKSELLEIETHAEYLRKWDYHYDSWFQDHLVSFPYAPRFLRDPDHVRFALYSALADIEEWLDTSLPMGEVSARQSEAETRLDQKRAAYHEELYETEADLFESLVAEFVDFAEEKDFTPVFMMVQQLRYAAYEEEEPIYGDLLDRLDERHPDLVTVDMGERLSDTDEVESLYVQHGEGGHYSPETNERIADILAAELFEKRDIAEPAQ
ncbi:MAG: hypothetical protein ABEJ60_01585 [Halodesulfurarchaeum sp.]